MSMSMSSNASSSTTSSSNEFDADVHVVVFAARGSEEIELVTCVDVLRRAGARVTIAKCVPKNDDGDCENDDDDDEEMFVTCSRDVKVKCDATTRALMTSARTTTTTTDARAVIVPGGMPGASNIALDRDAMDLIKCVLKSENGIVAAMCAAPVVVLARNGMLDGKRATAHPAFANELRDRTSVDARVVVDGRVITSRGPGTAIEFALAIVSALYGVEKAREVAKPMVTAGGGTRARVANEWTLDG